MTYISSGMVLGLQQVNDNAGRLCFQNIVNASTISTSSEIPTAPATNLANASTTYAWEAADTATQTITIDNTAGAPVDYVGIARHNLAQLGLSIEIKFNGVIVLPIQGVSSAQALLFLFDPASPTTIEIIITGATNAPVIAVVYAGQSVTLERNIYVGHTPINYGRDRSVITGVSQSGEYLGEVVLNQTVSTSVDLQNLTPLWYRQNLDAFFAQSPRPPCFWAWRPESYPIEIGYCWVEGNPRPVNAMSNGFMSVSWNFRGIV